MTQCVSLCSQPANKGQGNSTLGLNAVCPVTWHNSQKYLLLTFSPKLSFQPANPTFPLKYMYVMENSMWVYFICLLRNKWIGVLINCYLATSWDFCVSLELNQQSSFESSNSLQIEPLNYFKKVAIINWTKNVIRFPYKQHLIHVHVCLVVIIACHTCIVLRWCIP